MYALLLMFAAVTPDIPDGTLLFVEGGSEIVMDFTDSPYSHVAIIFNDEKGIPYVYEAVKPVCRKITLSDYIKELEADNERKNKEMKIWLRKPKKLKAADAAKAKQYCEEQMGRKYRIKSYLTKKPEKGIHCGEMTARAMIAGGMKVKENPCASSPKDIMNYSSTWYQKPICFTQL